MGGDTLLFVLLALGLPLALGVQVLRRAGLSPRDDRLAFWGWAWMAGALATGLVLFAWTALGLPLRAAVAGPAALLLVLWGAGRLRRAPGADAAGADAAGDGARAATASDAASGAARAPHAAPRGGPLARAAFGAAVALALLLTADRIVRADATVIVVGDEAAIWSSRAKALWWAGGLDATYGAILSQPIGIEHPDYPLLDPLLQVHAFASAGRMLDVENRLPMQACGLAIVLALAGGLRRRCHPLLAGALVLLVATSTRFDIGLRFAEADGMVALGFLVALDALDRRRDAPRRAWVALLALATAFLVGSKHEGSLLAVALLAGAAACPDFRASWRAAPRGARGAAWALLPLLVLAAGWAVNVHYGFRNDMVDGYAPWPLLARTVAQAPERLLPASAAMAAHLVGDGPDTHRLILACVALALLFPRRLLRPSPSGLALLVAVVGYTLVYVGTPHGLAWHVRTSLPRLLLHLLPGAALWVGGAGQALLDAARGADAADGTRSAGDGGAAR